MATNALNHWSDTTVVMTIIGRSTDEHQTIGPDTDIRVTDGQEATNGKTGRSDTDSDGVTGGRNYK
jgi:hypothetical protein